nr:MAG TPA: hypothetical protein [Caudoviricetes sp.]
MTSTVSNRRTGWLGRPFLIFSHFSHHDGR